MRGLTVLAVLVPVLAVSSSRAQTPEGKATLSIEPVEATVGDRLTATLTVEVPEGFEVDPVSIGPRLGPFAVDDETWSAETAAPAAGETRRFRWSAHLSAFKTGALEVPPIVVHARRGTESVEVRSAPVSIDVRSVLAEGPTSEAPEIADLKPPASIPPRYGALYVALALLAVLLAVSGVVWWLHRRYAARLAAVPAPVDPFHREPPHVWVYRELQQLLDRRLAEQGLVDEFYAEVGRIVKTYLSGRYRVDLLERTTTEMADLLARSGTPEDATEHAHAILDDCDLVKFARRRPESSDWRTIVERVYSLVDATRAPDAGRGAA